MVTLSHCLLTYARLKPNVPPPRAMAMAISASVTVSMGLERKGALMVIFLVRRLPSSTSPGEKSM